MKAFKAASPKSSKKKNPIKTPHKIHRQIKKIPMNP
jgi:hypothetical protein